MKLQLSVLCILNIILQCSSYQSSYHMRIPLDLPDLSGVPYASLEEFPYHAMVVGGRKCNGILISENYVITPAVCVYGAKRILVFLGYQSYPIYSNTTNPKSKVYLAQDVLIHQDFIQVDEYRYLNNLALVKLPEATQIKPAKLATKHFIDLASSENAKANITGWMLASNTNLMLADVRLRSHDTCRVLFGTNLFVDQELCVKWPTLFHLNLLGNPVSINGNVIGFQTLTPECRIAVSSCSRNDLIVSLAPFMSWISEHTHLPVEEFTNSEHSSDDKFLYKLVEELKTSQANLNKKLDELGANFKTQLNEQVNDMRSEMRNAQAKAGATVLKLQEEIADARTEITNGLTATKADIGNVTQLIEEPNEKILNVEKGLASVVNAFKVLSAKVDTFEDKVDKIQIEASISQNTLHNLSMNFHELFHHVHHSDDINKEKFDGLETLIGDKYINLFSETSGNKARLDKTCDRLNLLETTVTEGKAYFEEKLLNNLELFKARLHELGVKAKQCCLFSDYEIPAN